MQGADITHCAIHCLASGPAACPAFTMTPECRLVLVDPSVPEIGAPTVEVYVVRG